MGPRGMAGQGCTIQSCCKRVLFCSQMELPDQVPAVPAVWGRVWVCTAPGLLTGSHVGENEIYQQYPEELGAQAGESRRGTTPPKERNQEGFLEDRLPELSPNMLTEHLLSTPGLDSGGRAYFEAEAEGVGKRRGWGRGHAKSRVWVAEQWR